MSELTREYLSSHHALMKAFTETQKSVRIELNQEALSSMKRNHYKLCFAKKVGNVFTVVWQSLTEYEAFTKFLWSPVYELFATNSRFENGLKVEATTNVIPIELGQKATRDSDGWIQEAIGGGSETALTFINEGISIRPGVNQLCVDEKGNLVSKPIYVASEQVGVLSTTELTPKEVIRIWFEQNVDTSTMISRSWSPHIDVDLTGKNADAVTYDSKTGKWTQIKV